MPNPNTATKKTQAVPVPKAAPRKAAVVNEPVKLNGIAGTDQGYAVVEVTLTVAEFNALVNKKQGLSQEYVKWLIPDLLNKANKAVPLQKLKKF